MGRSLLKFYEEAQKMGGLKAKMRLAILTNVPSTAATEALDSPENLKKFEKALQELRKEF